MDLKLTQNPLAFHPGALINYGGLSDIPSKGDIKQHGVSGPRILVIHNKRNRQFAKGQRVHRGALSAA